MSDKSAIVKAYVPEFSNLPKRPRPDNVPGDLIQNIKILLVNFGHIINLTSLTKARLSRPTYVSEFSDLAERPRTDNVYGDLIPNIKIFLFNVSCVISFTSLKKVLLSCPMSPSSATLQRGPDQIMFMVIQFKTLKSSLLMLAESLA